MPHLTFIHGIANKPPADSLLSIWKAALGGAGGIDFTARRVTASMVYWADVLYAEPLAAGAEGVAGAEDVGAAAMPPERELIAQLGEAVENSDEAAFLAGLSGKLLVSLLKSQAARLGAGESAGDIAELPLPWSIKEPLLEVLLRDVHHYLFNKSFSPRPGQTYRVQDEIRRRFVAELRRHEGSRPHIVVCHSMGAVIAYDCLQRVTDCPAIEGLMTIGSPLGYDEIQDKMRPQWSRDNGFPIAKLRGRWVNVFDRLDPVAGFDPKIANDYQRGGQRAVIDVSEPNHGLWRHSIDKYLSGPQLRAQLRSLAQLPATEAAALIEPVMPTPRR